MISETVELAPVERRLLEQYFNTFCRETGRFDPRLGPSDAGPAGLRTHVASWRAAGLVPYALELRGGGCQLVGALAYFSPIGYHRVAPVAWLGDGQDWQPLVDVTQLVDLIAASIAAPASAGGAIEHERRLRRLMRDSVQKVRLYHEHAPTEHRVPFVAAEQGLRFGHVFHVTSKASEGFDHRDMQRYAPELGASFQLHYFAVAADLMDEHRADAQPLPIDPQAAELARDLIADAEYRLLPAHPWQAKHLLRQPDFAALVDRGRVISLGALGETAWPTSSVRTVWLPRQAVFLKLPLNVRITNFVRDNPDDHVRRALDASRALTWLPDGHPAQHTFRVLRELGSQTLAAPGESLRAACAVIHRQAPPAGEIEQVRVVASIAEESATGGTPLARLLRQAAGGQAPTPQLARTWWSHYLQVTLLPMLRLFCDHGISLEGHLQNSMVRFREGWPVCGYARDMEGTSISVDRFPFCDRLEPASPVLYTDEQAWHRFKYYVLVNHIGHMIACIARTGLATEAALWGITVQHLGAVRDPLVARLLDSPTLPAKANMMSSFHQHGERPGWVDIPNPARGQG